MLKILAKVLKIYYAFITYFSRTHIKSRRLVFLFVSFAKALDNTLIFMKKLFIRDGWLNVPIVTRLACLNLKAGETTVICIREVFDIEQ